MHFFQNLSIPKLKLINFIGNGVDPSLFSGLDPSLESGINPSDSIGLDPRPSSGVDPSSVEVGSNGNYVSEKSELPGLKQAY